MASPNSSPAIILVVESDPVTVATIRTLVEELGAICLAVSGLQAAQAVLRQAIPDVVIAAYELADGTGIELISQLRLSASHRATPAILLTGHIRTQELERAVMQGMYAFLAKPFEHQELVKLVSAALAENVERVRK